MRAREVDAFIAVTPANFRYLAGCPSDFVELSWQLTGTDMVVIPTKVDQQSVAIVNEYSAERVRNLASVDEVRAFGNWTENRPLSVVGSTDPAIVQRPQQYDFPEIFGMIHDLVSEFGAGLGRIGIELSLARHETVQSLQAMLPGVELVDMTAAMYDLRAIKTADEIALLRRAARLFDIGTEAAFDAAGAGITADQLQKVFDQTVRNVPGDIVEASFFFPHLGTGGTPELAIGDVVKIDSGARLDGYWSDGCRHAVLGPPSRQSQLIHDALVAGYEAARALLRPGVRMREVHEAGLQAVRKAGLPQYSRGHFGHSIGLDNHQEEPPFIGPNDAKIQANMVLCLELPYYPPDVGGFNIEDMFLITDTGAECLTHLRRDLRVL